MKNRIVLLIFFAAVFLVIISCRQGNNKEKEGFTNGIMVTKEIADTMDIGIGWNEATVLEGRWPERNFTPEEWDRYFGLMEWSGCHWLRHAVSITDWEPVNDNKDPSHTDWSRFTFHSPQMQRHFLFLDQAEKRNIKVLLTNWRLGAKWLAKDPADRELGHPASNDEFAESLAALVYYLKVVKKYNCIWALSLWNEPNGDWAYKGAGAFYPESFWPLYIAVDKQLRRLGVRDKILLLGPDTSTGGRPEPIRQMLAKYGPVVDVVCDHDYSAYRGESMDSSVAAYSRLIRGLRNVRGRRLPFVIGEFGNYGNGSGPVDRDDSVYNGALSTTAYLLRMLNAGASGLARWEFLIYGNRWRNFGALTGTDPDYLFKPYGPVYYPHAITARYIRPGWRVMQLNTVKPVKGIYASALTSLDSDLTIMLINDNQAPVTLPLEVEVPLKVPAMHRLSVTGPVPEGINQLTDVKLNNGSAVLDLPARSFTTLTTLDPGDLELPGRLALNKK